MLASSNFARAGDVISASITGQSSLSQAGAFAASSRCARPISGHACGYSVDDYETAHAHMSIRRKYDKCRARRACQNSRFDGGVSRDDGDFVYVDVRGAPLLRDVVRCLMNELNARLKMPVMMIRHA